MRTILNVATALALMAGLAWPPSARAERISSNSSTPANLHQFLHHEDKAFTTEADLAR